MLTGEPPHTGATAQAIIARLMTETPRRDRARRGPPFPRAWTPPSARAVQDARRPLRHLRRLRRRARREARPPSPRGQRSRRGLAAARARGGRARRHAAAFAVRHRAAAAGANLNSIAVLPFVDQSGDGSDAHLGDGIAETLISALTRVPGLEVAARTSAFTFRGKSDDLAGDGPEAERGHRAGGERAAGRRADRVTSQLVNVGTGRTMWSGHLRPRRRRHLRRAG